MAEHPIRSKLIKQTEGVGSAPLQEIPIKLFFNKADKAITINYQAFDTTSNLHAPVCSGDGRNAKRIIRGADNVSTLQDVACRDPERCELVASGQAVCRRQVRMSVQIDGQVNPFSVFEVRTSSINAFRAMRAQLLIIERRFGGLRHVPLKLTLWQASNEASSYQPFSVMQLALNADNEFEAMKKGKVAREQIEAAGLNDDVDTALDPMAPSDEFGLPSLEFQGVREFYEPVTRRTETQSAAPAAIRLGRVGAAADMIGQALNLSVRRDVAGPTQAAPSPR